MDKQAKTLVMLMILGLFISSSKAIPCFECNSDQTSDCEDPFDSVPTKCNHNLCVKQKTYIDGLLTIYLHCRLFCSVDQLFMT